MKSREPGGAELGNPSGQCAGPLEERAETKPQGAMHSVSSTLTGITRKQQRIYRGREVGGKKQAGGPEAKSQNAMRLRAATRAKADKKGVRETWECDIRYRLGGLGREDYGGHGGKRKDERCISIST